MTSYAEAVQMRLPYRMPKKQRSRTYPGTSLPQGIIQNAPKLPLLRNSFLARNISNICVIYRFVTGTSNPPSMP
jgi:hypothetical protein